LARNRLQHTFGVAQDISVPKTQDPVTLRLNEKRSSFVVIRCVRVLSAIQFNDQPFCETGEVGEVGTDRHLPTPLEPRQLRSERAPQALLGIGRGTTKLPGPAHGSCFRFVVGFHSSTSPFRRFAAPSLSLGRGIIY
jgi:hypothetical protein